MSQTNQPTVACIMLVNGREAMVRRAIKSFREQTYQRKKLLIYDTTPEESLISYAGIGRHESTVIVGPPEKTIGGLRNSANGEADTDAEILIHWDSDDWSHPNRIAEQVALLQSSGKQCVGYQDMLFWKQEQMKSYTSTHSEDCDCGTCGPGQRTVVVGEHDLGSAWLYTNPDQRYCLGTSLCYWRSVWEARPFPDLPKPGKERGGVGEDTKWLEGVDSLGVSSMQAPIELSPEFVPPEHDGYNKPRMIASIHGGNTQYYDPATYIARQQGTSWKRAAECDNFCLERMAL